MRQCDSLDGLADGVINNYVACRAIFDVSQGARNRHPWSAKRCANNVDPNPGDTSATPVSPMARSRRSSSRTAYRFATPLANGTQSFGMWVPNTDPSGSGLFSTHGSKAGRCSGGRRDALASRHPWCDRLSAKNLSADPLDYTEGGAFNRAVRNYRRSRRDEPGSQRSTNGRQDARHDRHQRHVGVARCAAGLLSVGSRQDGTGDCRSICPFVGDAANGSWAERQQPQRLATVSNSLRLRRSRIAMTRPACCSIGSRTTSRRECLSP